MVCWVGVGVPPPTTACELPRGLRQTPLRCAAICSRQGCGSCCMLVAAQSALAGSRGSAHFFAGSCPVPRVP
eukprot:11869758-Alexandrium_andersonii.AAC.1